MQATRAKSVGIVDQLGYLWCSACALNYKKTGHQVHGAPHAMEPCEGCGATLARTLPKGTIVTAVQDGVTYKGRLTLDYRGEMVQIANRTAPLGYYCLMHPSSVRAA